MTNKLKILVKAIWDLSLSYEEQKKIFPDFVVLTDELALNFANALERLEDTDKDYLIKQKVMDEIVKVDSLLSSNDPETWEEKSLQASEFWNMIRIKTKIIIKGLEIDELRADEPYMYIQ